MASLLFISVFCAVFLEQYVSGKPSDAPNLMTNSAATDLKGQMFSVNKEGWVKMQAAAAGTLQSCTVCLRHMSENDQNQTFFALNLGSQYHIFIQSNSNWLKFTVGGATETFLRFFPVSNVNSPWTALCITWMSSSGMAQVWKDGMPSVRKGMWRYQVFTGLPVLTIYGFLGQVTDVHVWNYVLSPSAIASFSRGTVSQEGTVISWRKALYTTGGYVVLEPIQFSSTGLGKAKQPVEKKKQHENDKKRSRVM